MDLPSGLVNYALNELKTVYFRAKIIFGLNALYGKSVHRGHTEGPWNYTNAESFIQYTVGKNYDIHGWELGKYISSQ